jgi:L-amino acid N-acyltransferase YncA
VHVRQADADRDASACAEIYAPFVVHTAISFEERPPDEDEMRQRIERTMARYPWLVAEDDDRVIGYAYASPHRDRAAYRWAADVAIYVDSGHRRRGIGRALYETLFKLLLEQGIQMACAGITLPNPASVTLHQRVGFEPVGVYRRIGWKAGAWHDVAWYQRELIPPGDQAPPEPGPPGSLPAQRTG